MRITFNGDLFKEELAELDKLSKTGLKEAAETALKEAQDAIARELEPVISKHRRSGATQASLVKDQDVTQSGDVFSIGIGFDIGNGGLPSIFLAKGTPRMNPDNKLNGLLYGSQGEKIIQDAEKKALDKLLEKYMG